MNSRNDLQSALQKKPDWEKKRGCDPQREDGNNWLNGNVKYPTWKGISRNLHLSI
jgi:hypothetical protein